MVSLSRIIQFSEDLNLLLKYQFILYTFGLLSRLDGKHVVFGKVKSGMNIVSAIEQVGSDSGRTRVPVMIMDSGQLR